MLVIVAGMPRSGSTLQSNIGKFILEGSGIGRRVEWSVDWQEDLDSLKRMISATEVYLLKTHWVSDAVLALACENGDTVSFLVSHRDVRDVAVSMMVKFDYSFNKAVQRIGQAIDNIERLRNTECKVLEQDYSLLRYDLQKAVEDIASFINVNLSDDDRDRYCSELNIELSYKKSRNKKIYFESVRRKLAFLLRTKFPYADSELMLHSGHVSEHKGESGIWKKRLPEKQCKVLTDKFPNWLSE